MSALRRIARLLPSRQREMVRSRIRGTQRSVRDFLLRRAVANRFAAAAYYAFANHELLRESRAVAAGQLRYAADHKSGASSYFLLRRNIHRLEKGLIMRPRRPVFATDFIDETVATFDRAMTAAAGEWNSELVWADDVLTDYFAVVDTADPKVAGAYARFVAVEKAMRAPAMEARSVPYARDLSGPAPVAFDAFMALTRRRRSVRWYLDRPVPRDLVDRALAAAGQAPSACNRQPFMFRIFDDPARAAEVAAIPMGTRGFSQQLPAVAVVVGQLRAYPYERDRHVIYIDGSLAAMSFMLALETLGLSSVPINWPDQEPHESRMRAALNLAEDERVVMLIGFGWPDPDGQVPYSTKRPVPEMRTYG
ncbi:nitroreductase family protein [Sphingomonas profundi]|uniref:nitroreductase family protein n=1 Tax=Alterirhizorhabdus profundi TaxID=2681549 RepID=UPI0012E97C0A|nr:nitroreductase family protein [Sphingomonas profundi]